MNFVDKVSVKLAAGNGGNGFLSFHREKFITKGGPDGGDGGKGGDVVFIASSNQDTLASFRYQKELRAEPGQAGSMRKKHGKNGQNLEVKVPVGTVVTDETGSVLADLTIDGDRSIIAHGGNGGFGNAHFVSSTRQAPKFAEKGELGDVFTLTLELKMIADVGLVGLPNAGKSTLLSKISNARPEIADYPFTTLIPNLGVVDISGYSALFADIPGLIEGASDGKGLGHDFLRHIERTAVIVHLIDAYDQDVIKSYKTVQRELEAYSPVLLKRPELVVLNKIDGLDEKTVKTLLVKLKKILPKKTSLFAISALAGTGLNDLLFTVKDKVKKERSKKEAELAKDSIPVITLDDSLDEWHVSRDGDTFLVSGPKIERFGMRTDFSNQEGVQRLRDVMRRFGIIHELERQGIKPGQKINIRRSESIEY